MSQKLLDKFRKITLRYQKGIANPEEVRAVEKYYELFDQAPGIEEKLNANDIEDMKLQLLSAIQQNKSRKHPSIYYKPLLWLGVAASMVIAIGIFLTLNSGNRSVSAVSAGGSELKISKYTSVPYTRNIILPDKSHIILKAGSEIVLGKSFIRGATREVTLQGEAFFDIQHNSKRPFIIHTGNLKTTVLGTAFNINFLNGKSVEVSVVRGRVKVEKDGSLVAVLRPNRQVSVQLDSTITSDLPREVNAKKITDWTAKGMSFEGKSFGSLASLISERYSVKVAFDNPKLQNCLITGSFTGLESLEEILKILSQTRGTTYQIKGDNIIISGKDCN